MPLTPVFRQNGPLRGLNNLRGHTGTTRPLNNNLANNLVEIEKVNGMWKNVVAERDERIRDLQDAQKAMMQRHSMLNNDIIQRNASLQKEMMHQQAQIELLHSENIQQRVLIKVLRSEKEEAERLLGNAKDENARLQEKLRNLEEINLLATEKKLHKEEEKCQVPPVTGYAGQAKARTRGTRQIPSRVPEPLEETMANHPRARTYIPKSLNMERAVQAEHEDPPSDAESCCSNNHEARPMHVRADKPLRSLPVHRTMRTFGRAKNAAAHSTSDMGNEAKADPEPPKREMRARAVMSYKEPPLHTKLRRPR